MKFTFLLLITFFVPFVMNSQNTFYGEEAGELGSRNSFFGAGAGQSNVDRDNTFIGYNSGILNKESSNTFIGSYSGRSNSGSGNVFLGSFVGADSEESSNLLYIDNSNTNSPLIWGDFNNNYLNINGRLGIGISSPSTNLEVKGDLGIRITEQNSNFGARILMTDSFTNLTSKDDLLFSTPGGFMFKMDDNSNGTGSQPGFNVYNNINESVFTIKESNANVGIGIVSPQEKLHINGSIRGNSSGGALRIKSTSGYMDVGAQNASYAHIYTDRPRIIFNKDVYTTTGAFSSYDDDLIFKTSGTERFRVNNTTGGVGINGIEDDTQLCVASSYKVGIKSITTHSTDYQFGILSAVNRVNTKALSVMLLENGDYVDTFAVMGDGRVKSTEVEVKVPIFPDYVFDKDYDLMPLSELKKYINKNKHLPNIPKAEDVVSNGLKIGDMQVKQMEKIEELTLHIIEQDERINKLEKMVLELIKKKTSKN